MKRSIVVQRRGLFAVNFACGRFATFFTAVIIVMAAAFFATQVQAAQVILAWDASTGQVTGYKVHYKTADTSYQAIDVGDVTTYTVTGLTEGTTYTFAVSAYNASEESSLSATVTYTPPASTPPPISVPPTGTTGQGAPVAQNDTATTPENQSVTVNLLANDSDPDGNTLTVSSITQPSHGTVSLLGSNAIYMPAAGFSGTDSFSYAISDGAGGTASAQVTITVASITQNQPPVASDSSLTVQENNVAHGTLTAQDPDGNPLQYILVSDASKGTVQLVDPQAGTFTYTPNTNATGSDSFTFKVNDGEQDSNIATVTITISAPVVFALNAGGPKYVDANGTVYQADTNYTGGATFASGAAIGGTEDDRLYQSERYGNFDYNIPLANGSYLLTLKFAEIYFSSPGQRKFSAWVGNQQVVTDLDLFAEAGKDHAYDVTVPVTVTDGYLDVSFQSSVNNAKLSALEISKPVQKSAPVVFALNAGGPKYVDANGTVYQADTNYTGGATFASGAAISGTEDDRLYQSERYGNFDYNIPLANGSYLLTLKFAEIYFSSPGQRKFSAWVGNQQVVTDLDLFAEAGKDHAYDVTVPVTVTDGYLDISFQSSVNNAKLSALEISKPVQKSTPVVFALNAGGPKYVDANGTVYQADTNYTGGATFASGAAIGGTEDDRLYQSERYGNFDYNIPLANGSYLLTLKFAEIYFSSPGQRMFSAWVGNQQVVSSLDLFAEAGKDHAYDVTVPVTVTDGYLDVSFQSSVNNAKLSALEIEKAPAN